MRKFAVILIVVLLLTMSTAAFAAYSDVKMAQITLISDQGVLYILEYPYSFHDSSTICSLEVFDDNKHYYIKSSKGQPPQGAITTCFSSIYPLNYDYSKEHDLANDKPDNDCTETYEYTYWFGVNEVNTRKVDFKLTRAAASAHDWGEWTMDADGNHVRSCKHPVCTVTQSHAPGEWFLDENDHHTRSCEVEGCTLTVESHAPGEWIAAGDVHVRTCDVAYCGLKNESAKHAGGSATTTQKAVCTVCGAEYGSLAVPLPETGDGANFALWISLVAISSIGMAMLLRRKKEA